MNDDTQIQEISDAGKMAQLVQDRAVVSELVAIGKTKAKKIAIPRPRRFIYQVFNHTEMVVDHAFALRDAERKLKHLDIVQDLTEMIYHLKQAQAHLRRVSLRLYAKQPEDLASYK